MGEIRKAAETYSDFCANCTHSKFHHIHITKRDQSRSSHAKTYLSYCRQCGCKEFKSKS